MYCLYVAPAENMVGRVRLIPLFLAGNSTPKIPHKFSKRKDSGFPFGCADAAGNVYEVNPWPCQFGRGKPHLGGLTVEDTTERKKAARDERIQRGWETRWHSKADNLEGRIEVKSGYDLCVCM